MVKCRSKRRACAPAELTTNSAIRIVPLTWEHTAEPDRPFIDPPRRCDPWPLRARRPFVDKPHTNNRGPWHHRVARAPIFHSRRLDYPRYPGFHATSWLAQDCLRGANRILASYRRRVFCRDQPPLTWESPRKCPGAPANRPRTFVHSPDSPPTSLQ